MSLQSSKIGNLLKNICNNLCIEKPDTDLRAVLQQSLVAPLAPYFCSWATRESKLFYRNTLLGTLDFTGSEHQASFTFS